jgi:hypothetical protein
VKQLFTKLGASFKAIELDVEGESTYSFILFLFLRFHAIHLIRLYARWVVVVPRAGTPHFRQIFCLSLDVPIVLYYFVEMEYILIFG